MKIIQVAPLWARVPPEKYGGIEAIVADLANGLVERGHEVTLFASGDSKTKAKLIPISDKSLYEKNISWTNPYYSLMEISLAVEFAEKNHYDLIHNHLNYPAFPFARISKVPMLTTNHGAPLKNDLEDGKRELVKEFKDIMFVSIAKHMQKLVDLNFVANVYNGIHVNQFQFDPVGGNKLIWLGRFTPIKGAHYLIKVAKATKVPMLLAGKIDEKGIDYFNQSIKPYIDGKQITWIGEIGGYKNKSDFMHQGKVFINPIDWEEPFGLVVPEANACGTPVVAFARGSMPELIKDGFNGYLVKPGDIKSMTKAVQRIYQMPEAEYRQMRLNCRKHVEENFTVERMVDSYEQVYKKILKSGKKR